MIYQRYLEAARNEDAEAVYKRLYQRLQELESLAEQRQLPQEV